MVDDIISESSSVGDLIAQARAKIVACRQPSLETFVPLYLTNLCDGLCRVCNMRSNNRKLTRIQGRKEDIYHQLQILHKIEGISAVCLLTGEYHLDGSARAENLELVTWSIKQAFSQNFDKVYINIGALTDQEIVFLSEQLGKDTNRLVLSLFQETYHREDYNRFFGGNSPKADYDLRFSTPLRWLAAGFRQVDIGILLGLRPPDLDVEHLIKHAKTLYEHGAEVAISLPRLRGLKKHPYQITDEEFKRIVVRVADACPWSRVIATTREDIAMIKELLPIVGIVSPGTSDVLPYTESGAIPNNQATSQFQVAPTRPRPSWVLDSLEVSTGIKYYKSGVA
mgnify:CR=1 FL=1